MRANAHGRWRTNVLACHHLLTLPYDDRYIQMIPEVGTESYDPSQSNVVIDATKRFEKILNDLLTAEVSPIRAALNEKNARIEALELEIEVGLCPLTWVLGVMLIS